MDFPTLRFKIAEKKEFSNYQSTKIGDLCTVETGNKDTQDKVDNGYYDFYVRSQKIEKINTYSFEGEAILTAGDGVGVGKVFHYVNGKFDFHQRVYKLSDFKDVLGKYLFYYFSKNFYREAMKYNAKSSVDSVRREMITNMPIKLPQIEEQEIIVKFFEFIDKKIQLQQEKIDLLKVQKKGFMKRIFQKEIDFNTNSEWKEIKVQEVFLIIDGDRGKNYPNEDEFFENGHTLFLDTKNVTKDGFKFNTKKFITQEKSEKLNNGLLLRNDIILTSRGSIGNIALYDETIPFSSIRINSAMLILRLINPNINLHFAYHLLKSKVLLDFIRSSSVGSAQPHITKGDLKSLKLNFPVDMVLQEKIASFLSKIDTRIKLEEDKLFNLGRQKQGFMQQMFI